MKLSERILIAFCGIALAVLLSRVACCEERIAFHGGNAKVHAAFTAAFDRARIPYRVVRAAPLDMSVIHVFWIEGAIHFTRYGPPMIAGPVQGDYFIGNSEIIWFYTLDGYRAITACADTWKHYCTADMIDFEVKLATEK